MSGGHAHGLYVHAHSAIHELQPQCKIVATLLFILAVVATPARALWAFAAFTICLLVTARFARVRTRFIVRRLVVEIPFLFFAVLLPFIAAGERTSVVGVSLSVDGLMAAWNVGVKATLGVATTVLLGATTPVAEILHGLERLHMPRVITAIAHFMIRYADVITGEMKRMRIARESRGHDPRFLWQATAVAASLGALFVRSYERGERVYLAMIARGYSGTIPVTNDSEADLRAWTVALTLPVTAALIAGVASILQ